MDYVDLIHCLEICRAQTKAGFAVTDRLCHFLKAVAKLQQSFGQELKKLAASELARLNLSTSATTPPGRDGEEEATMESSRNGLQRVITLVQEAGELQIQSACSNRSQVVGRLSSFYKRAELKGRELDTQLRYYVGECEKAQEELQKAESSAVKHLRSLSRTWATESEAEANLQLKRRSRSGGFSSLSGDASPRTAAPPGMDLLESKKVSRSRVRAAQSCEKYMQVVEKVNFTFQHRQGCLRKALTEMQELEIERIHEVKAVLDVFADSQEQLNRDTNRLVKVSKEVISTVDGKKDVSGFVRRVIDQRGLAPPGHMYVNPTPFQYDLACTPGDLRDDGILYDSLLAANGRPLGTSSPGSPDGNRGRLFSSPLHEVLEVQQRIAPDIIGVREADLEHCNRLQLPLVARVLIDGVRKFGGFGSVGIFRISATTESRNALVQELESGDYSLTAAQRDPHVCAGTLKTWLRELKPALISGDAYTRCLEISSRLKADPGPGELESLRKDMISVVDSLPLPNRRLLGLLIQLIQEVDQQREVNRMGTKNMAIVLAPNILSVDDSSLDPSVLIQHSDLATQFITELASLDYDYSLDAMEEEHKGLQQQSQPPSSPFDASLADFFDLAASTPSPPALPNKPKLPTKFLQQRQ